MYVNILLRCRSCQFSIDIQITKAYEVYKTSIVGWMCDDPTKFVWDARSTTSGLTLLVSGLLAQKPVPAFYGFLRSDLTHFKIFCARFTQNFCGYGFFAPRPNHRIFCTWSVQNFCGCGVLRTDLTKDLLHWVCPELLRVRGFAHRPNPRMFCTRAIPVTRPYP
jgi:hypothetical protein